MSFFDYLATQISLGYEEGKSGREYSGRTWHGYYAYLAGKEGEPKPAPINNA